MCAAPENTKIDPILAPGNYALKYNFDRCEFFLEEVPGFSMPPKFYGNVEKLKARIIQTFIDRNKSTGVLLLGDKGSGKSMLAKAICANVAEKFEVPTIIIGESFDRLDEMNVFLAKIAQPCVVFFDEFEKVFKNEEQEKILTLFDGVYSTNKLFLVTCNNRYAISSHMFNRPGRIFYNIVYGNISEAEVVEYCNDNLKNKSFISDMLKLTLVAECFNFDMMQAIVEECNRFDESPFEVMKFLNVSIFDYKGGMDYSETHEIDVTYKGKKIELDRWDVYGDNPIMGEICFYPSDKAIKNDNSTISFSGNKYFNRFEGKTMLFTYGDFVVRITKKPPASFALNNHSFAV